MDGGKGGGGGSTRVVVVAGDEENMGVCVMHSSGYIAPEVWSDDINPDCTCCIQFVVVY